MFEEDNMKVYEALRYVPNTAKKPIAGGRLKGMTDVNPLFRIKALTTVFGPCGKNWYYREVDRWKETLGEQVAVFVKINLYVKYDNEWSMPIEGIGGSMLIDKEKNGLYLSDEAYKMATTDAISVACKNLGVAADVYWGKDADYGTKYEIVTPPQKPVFSKTTLPNAWEKGVSKQSINPITRERLEQKFTISDEDWELFNKEAEFLRNNNPKENIENENQGNE